MSCSVRQDRISASIHFRLLDRRGPRALPRRLDSGFCVGRAGALWGSGGACSGASAALALSNRMLYRNCDTAIVQRIERMEMGKTGYITARVEPKLKAQA